MQRSGQLRIICWALFFCCRYLITHRTISFSLITYPRKRMRWCCPCYSISKFSVLWIPLLPLCCLSWQVDILEIRGFESISVFCVTAKITDVRCLMSWCRNQVQFSFFFWVAFDCVSYLLSICTGFELVINMKDFTISGTVSKLALVASACVQDWLNYFHRMILRSIVMGTGHTKNSSVESFISSNCYTSRCIW